MWHFLEKMFKFELKSSSRENRPTFKSGNQYDRLTQRSFLETVVSLSTNSLGKVVERLVSTQYMYTFPFFGNIYLLVENFLKDLFFAYSQFVCLNLYKFLIEFYAWEFSLYTIFFVASNKPTDVSESFQDRHVMEPAEFDTFHTKASTDSLTSSEITTLKNWRK